MRISDWSSDVCSSDLVFRELKDGRNGVVVVVVPAGAGHGIAGTAEEIVAALVGMGLPISRRLALAALRLVVGGGVARHQRRGAAVLAAAPVAAAARQGGARCQSQDPRGAREPAHERSEERRVGKEGASQCKQKWWRD